MGGLQVDAELAALSGPGWNPRPPLLHECVILRGLTGQTELAPWAAWVNSLISIERRTERFASQYTRSIWRDDTTLLPARPDGSSPGCGAEYATEPDGMAPCWRSSRPAIIDCMQVPIRVGVVGFGLAGKVFHTAIIRATPGLELACVVQRSGDEAEHALPGVRIARSVEEMLGDVSIPLVVIATPSYSHSELARQCLREQRHVVIDKPFTLASGDAAELIRMARERNLLLAPYQNRRWDGDFQTVRLVLASGDLGRLVTYESHFDRFRPQPRHDVWRESGGPGSGILFDLGPHLIDQALQLFGPPTHLQADVRIDRDSGTADDAWDLWLEFMNPRRITALLRATLTACAPGPRFVLHGTEGSFVKWGLDPQEAQLRAGMPSDDPQYGFESPDAWGELSLAGGETRRVPTVRGDYRDFYANVRDALLGKAELAVRPEQAWQTTRLIELARESSGQGRRLKVDFSTQP